MKIDNILSCSGLIYVSESLTGPITSIMKSVQIVQLIKIKVQSIAYVKKCRL